MAICENSTKRFGRVHERRTIGIENKSTSKSNFILLRSKLRNEPFLIFFCANLIYMKAIGKT
jgi:hypothetical protein